LLAGGVLYTINIAEADRPRRWRAHRHCTNGRAVSRFTCWVALALNAELPPPPLFVLTMVANSKVAPESGNSM